MELDAGGLGGCGVIVLVLVLVVGAVLVVPGVVADLKGAEAQRTLAEAQRVRAQADLETARSVSFENRFMLWTSWLAAEDDDLGPLVFLTITSGALAALAGYTLGRRGLQ